MRKKNIVILGMHRSGTSLFASWMSKCGLNLGSDLMGLGVGNELGHFEDLDFHDLHESILRRNRIPYGGLKKMEHLKLLKLDLERIKDLINKKAQKAKQFWGWKDPRTCLFLDAYRDILPSDTVYLVVYRNYWDVVDSLIRRQAKITSKYSIMERLKYGMFRLLKSFRDTYLTPDEALVAWCVYNEKILENIPFLEDVIIINQDGLKENWQLEFNKITEKISLNMVPFTEIFKGDLYTENNRSEYFFDEGILNRARIVEDRFSQYFKTNKK